MLGAKSFMLTQKDYAPMPRTYRFLSCLLLLVMLLPLTLPLESPARAQMAPGTVIFEFEGRERSYFPYEPESYTGESAVPLIIMLHGAQMRGFNMLNLARLSTLADAQNALVIFPNAVGPLWQDGTNYSSVPNVPDPAPNDTAFIAEVIRLVQESYNVDASRIYLMGWNNGGLMAMRAACELAADTFAGLAVVMAGFRSTLEAPCATPAPLPFMLITGTADDSFPSTGWVAQFGEEFVLQYSPRQTVQYWALVNGCDFGSLRLTQAEGSALRYEDYPICSGAPLRWIQIEGGTGNYPSPIAGDPSRELDATQAIWEFFVAVNGS